MEGLGDKFKKARTARNLTLDEAARLTKIRPGRLAELEAEDFSNFPSLAYAKGFVQIYGKFLNVDVSPYLEAFETSSAMTVDGYSYLQETTAPPPPRTIVRAPRQRPSLAPLLIGLAVLFIGFSVMRLFLNMQRIAPAKASPTPAATASPAVSPAVAAAPTATPAVPPTPPPQTPPLVAAATPTPASTPEAPATPAPAASPTKEPEVRRAIPVNPEDIATIAQPAPAAEGTNQLEIRPLKRTFVRVIVDGDPTRPVVERWISPRDEPITVSGRNFDVRVLDSSAVEIRKNGTAVDAGDPDIRIQE